MRSYLQKLVMPVYCVIGKIPAVRNISNKIIVFGETWPILRR